MLSFSAKAIGAWAYGGIVETNRSQVPVSIQSRAGNASPDGVLAAPTGTNRQEYDIAAADFAAEYAKLKPILTTEIAAIEQELDRLGAPPTPGRIPPAP